MKTKPLFNNQNVVNVILKDSKPIRKHKRKSVKQYPIKSSVNITNPYPYPIPPTFTNTSNINSEIAREHLRNIQGGNFNPLIPRNDIFVNNYNNEQKKIIAENAFKDGLENEQKSMNYFNSRFDSNTSNNLGYNLNDSFGAVSNSEGSDEFINGGNISPEITVDNHNSSSLFRSRTLYPFSETHVQSPFRTNMSDIDYHDEKVNSQINFPEMNDAIVESTQDDNSNDYKSVNMKDSIFTNDTGNDVAVSGVYMSTPSTNRYFTPQTIKSNNSHFPTTGKESIESRHLESTNSTGFTPTMDISDFTTRSEREAQQRNLIKAQSKFNQDIISPEIQVASLVHKHNELVSKYTRHKNYYQDQKSFYNTVVVPEYEKINEKAPSLSSLNKSGILSKLKKTFIQQRDEMKNDFSILDGIKNGFEKANMKRNQSQK